MLQNCNTHHVLSLLSFCYPSTKKYSLLKTFLALYILRRGETRSAVDSIIITNLELGVDAMIVCDWMIYDQHPK